MRRSASEAPVNAIWEGSGNVMCLDVLRAIGRSPEALAIFFEEITLARGADRRLDAFVDRLRADLADFDAVETRARGLVERMALALQGSLLARHADAALADAFSASRLAGEHGLAFGTLPRGIDFHRIIERARPKL